MTNISETFFDCISFQRVTANSFAFGIVEDNEDVRKWRRKKAKYEGKNIWEAQTESRADTAGKPEISVPAVVIPEDKRSFVV